MPPERIFLGRSPTSALPASSRQRVLLAFATRQAFLENHLDRAELDGVFVPGHLAFSIGEPVELEIAFADPPMVFRTRGIVRWKRLRSAGNLPAGLGVAYEPGERAVAQLILDFARGGTARRLRARARRFAATLSVEVTASGVPIAAQTEDLSREGAFLRMDGRLELGTRLRLRVSQPETLAEPIDVDAEVVWSRTRPRRGVGLRFVLPDAAARIRIAALVARVRGASVRVPS